MFLIHGYLGYGNYGDDILLDLLSKAINTRYKDINIQTLSSKNSFFQHLKLISSSKEMICIGGLFQDSSGIMSLLYYFSTIFLAKFYNKPIRFLSTGIGPLKSSLAKSLSYLAFRMADIVSVRDRASSILLKEWGIDHYYGSDLAWNLYSEEHIKSDSSKLQISDLSRIRIDGVFGSLTDFEKENKVIALVLRNRPEGFNQAWNRKIVNKIIEEIGDNSVLLIDFCDDDIKINQCFKEIFSYNKKSDDQKCLSIKAKNYSPQELIYMLKNYCHTIIGMRLHALILSHIAGLKITAIPVDPKIIEFDHQVDVYNLETLKDRAFKHYEKVLFLDL